MYDIDDESMQHDSDEDSSSTFEMSLIDQRVSHTTTDSKIVDFGMADQPRELRIRLDLSTNERDNIV